MSGLYAKYRDATMIPEREFNANLELVRGVNVEGDVIEAGTWRGGMAAALVETCGPRTYHFFDSFEGLPPAEQIDGDAAHAWQANKSSDSYHRNCSATLAEFEATIDRAETEVSANVCVYPGWFGDTLPICGAEKVAVLRLDCDWFSSTALVLDAFWDRVVTGGLILIDDYYAWDGCSRAVHRALAQRDAAERIEARDGVAFIVKR